MLYGRPLKEEILIRLRPTIARSRVLKKIGAKMILLKSPTGVFNKVVEVCSSNPAKIFGCAPEKGSLTIGSDADLVIYIKDE